MKKNTKICHFCKYHQNSSLTSLPRPWNGSAQVLGLETSLPGTSSSTPKYCSQLLSMVTKLPVWQDSPVVHMFIRPQRPAGLLSWDYSCGWKLICLVGRRCDMGQSDGGIRDCLMSVSSRPDASARAAFLIYFPVPVKAYGDCWARRVVQREKAARKGQTGHINLCSLYTDLSIKKY